MITQGPPSSWIPTSYPPGGSGVGGAQAIQMACPPGSTLKLLGVGTGGNVVVVVVSGGASVVGGTVGSGATVVSVAGGTVVSVGATVVLGGVVTVVVGATEVVGGAVGAGTTSVMIS